MLKATIVEHTRYAVLCSTLFPCSLGLAQEFVSIVSAWFRDARAVSHFWASYMSEVLEGRDGQGRRPNFCKEAGAGTPQAAGQLAAETRGEPGQGREPCAQNEDLKLKQGWQALELKP